MKEAGRRGLKVGGHVPFEAGSLGSARLGYRSIEHARDLLYDCSRYGPEHRRREAAFANGVIGTARPSNQERLSRTVNEFDRRRCSALLGKLSTLDVYYTPTHVTRQAEALADDPAFRADRNRRYVPAERSSRWEADLSETAGLPLVQRSALKAFFQHGLTITQLAHRSGIPIMAGTDANDTMIVPGFSLHRELALLARAGLSNMDVLRSATAVPAAYLGRTADLGRIAPGMEADLVLLRANPLSSISNTTTVDLVVTNGRAFHRQQLDELLEEVELLARQPAP
jgi:hypothetical protein